MPVPPKPPNEPDECKSTREVSGLAQGARTCRPEVLSRNVDATRRSEMRHFVDAESLSRNVDARRRAVRKEESGSRAARPDPPRAALRSFRGGEVGLFSNRRRWMDGRTTIAGLLGLLLALADSPSDPARAQDVKPIGKVVTAIGKVTIEHADAALLQARLSDDKAGAKIGDPVYRGDVIKTGADGRVGINFADDSSFNLSSNASMEMNEFVYDPAGKSNSTLFSLARGTFTFVAGNAAKAGNMKVESPVATMGIRGTTPHIEI